MLAGIWRVSGFGSSQNYPARQASSPAQEVDNNTNLHIEENDPDDIMEGLQYENGNLESEGAEVVRGKKAKSRSKARKSKKPSKRAKEDSVSKEEADADPNGKLSVTDESDTAEKRVNGHNSPSPLLEDRSRPTKKSDAKSPQKKKWANRGAQLATENHNHNGDEEEAAAAPRTSDSQAQSPKMKKAKKAKTRKLSGASGSRQQEDIDDSQDAFLHPLTPAHRSRHRMEYPEEGIPGSPTVTQESTEISPSASEVHQGGTQPSKKALGKRKAVDEAGGQDRKKRARKSTSAQKDLRAMFQNQQSTNGLDNAHASASADLSDTQADQDMPDEPQRVPFEEAVLRASETRKRRKRRLPVDEDENVPSSMQKSGTPRATIPSTQSSLLVSAGNPARGTPRSNLTALDIAAITRAVENYRDFNNLTQRGVNELIQKSAISAESHDLWTAIYQEAPSVPRRSAHQFCRRNFHNYEGRGIWTEEQDAELREAYQRRPNKWTEIGQQLNRFPEDVRDRWRNYLVCDGNMKKDEWDQVEVQQLRNAVKACIKAIRDQKRQAGEPAVSATAEEKLIDWQTVSEKMNHTRSRLQCSYKWKRLKNFNGSDNEMDQPWREKEARPHIGTLSATDKLRLLRAVHESGASRSGKIPWGSISRDLNEKGKRTLWRLCIRELIGKFPGSEDMEYQETIRRLVDIFEESVPNEPDGYEIPLKKPKKKSKSKRKSDAKSTQAKESEDGEGSSSNANPKRKIKDRMRLQGESTPELAEKSKNGERAETIDSDKEAVTLLRSLKRSKTTRRKPKPKKFLSDERVVEDISDEEDALNEHRDEPSLGDGSDAAVGPGADSDVKTEQLEDQREEAESEHFNGSDAANSSSSSENERSQSIENDLLQERHDEEESAPESDGEEKPALELDAENEVALESESEEELAPEVNDENEVAQQSDSEDEPALDVDDDDKLALEFDDEDEPALEVDDGEESGQESGSEDEPSPELDEDESEPESAVEIKPVLESDDEDESALESDVEIKPALESDDDDESVPASDVEIKPTSGMDDDTQSIEPDEDHTITTNGFEKDGSGASSSTSSGNFESGEIDGLSPDKHQDSHRTPWHKLANRHVETFFNNDESDSESTHSSDSSASSIPARVKRSVSIEL